MRKYFGLLALACASLLTACSDISTEDRLIAVDAVQAQHNVLIEDFTGQSCVNCPKATEVIDTILKHYGEDHVIPVSIHSGPFSKNTKKTKTWPLWTATGDVYYDAFKISAQPTGYIGRTTLSSNVADWEATVREQLRQKPQVDISLSLSMNADSSELSATTTLSNLGDSPVQGKLQLWLVEDSIVSFQYMPDGKPTVKDYLHNHVFRAAVNGDWGEEVEIVKGRSTTVLSRQKLDSSWEPRHLSVVAFVYNDQGVLDVIKKHVE